MKQYKENDLPEGWAWAKIKYLVEINYGKGLKKERRKEGPFPVYGSNGVVDYHNAALTRGPTIILGRKGSIGAVHYSANSCWPIDTTYFVDEFNGLDPKYLVHALRSLNLTELDTSTAIPGLNRDSLYDQHVSIAPLIEQKRIVTKVEELLSRVTATKERLAKVSMILQCFRQAVLSAACSGHLTADWREKNSNIEPASELLKRVRVERKEPLQKVQNQEINTNDLPTIPESWAYTSIGELEIFIGSGITPLGGKSVYVKQGVPFIRSQNVYPTGLVIKDMAFITQEIHNKMSRTKLKEKDVLLNITGASIGRATYVPENFGEGNVNQHVCIIRLESVISYKFTVLFLNSPIGQDLIFSKQGGVTREGLNYGQVRNFIIPVPPLDEQQEIVRRVEAMFKLADTVEKRVETAILRAEKLTQTILAKAFRGELVPTEAELARREGRSYEPASNLLARIKAERESKESSQKVRRSRK